MNRGFVIFIMMLVCLPISIYGKTNNKGAVKKVVTKKALIFIDPNVDSLPANYSGTNIYDLYHELESEIPKKTEYETSDEYRRKVVENLPENFMAFVIKPNNFCLSYNPEIKKMMATYSTKSFNKYSKLVVKDNAASFVEKYSFEGVYSAVDLISIHKREREFVGINAYGVSVNASSTEKDIYGLIIINESAGKRVDIGVDMTPEDAMQNKENIRFLLIGKVGLGSDALKVVDYDFEGSSATLDHPSGYFYNKYYVFIDVRELWMYNYKTGFVYTKIKYD
jgi:hypothetical protein